MRERLAVKMDRFRSFYHGYLGRLLQLVSGVLRELGYRVRNIRCKYSDGSSEVGQVVAGVTCEMALCHYHSRQHVWSANRI